MMQIIEMTMLLEALAGLIGAVTKLVTAMRRPP